MRPAPRRLRDAEFVNKRTPEGLSPPTKARRTCRQWQTFVEALAERYGPDGDFFDAEPERSPNLPVKNWIIWNEQNAKSLLAPEADPRTTRSW